MGPGDAYMRKWSRLANFGSGNDLASDWHQAIDNISGDLLSFWTVRKKPSVKLIMKDSY